MFASVAGDLNVRLEEETIVSVPYLRNHLHSPLFGVIVDRSTGAASYPGVILA